MEINFKNWLINEMPISRFELQGQWGPNAKRAYGFNKQDTGILENPRAVEKIHRAWSNSKNNFNFYFIRSAKAFKHIEVGEVSHEWVKENLGVDIEPVDDTITIIFTNNRGAEKIAMTAWAIAHRLGHAIRRDDIFSRYLTQEIQRDFRELLGEIYGIEKRPSYNNFRGDEKELRALAQTVGTMRSARQGNLRNFFEFTYELVAQWLLTGRIKFNPLPRTLLLQRRMAWGNPAHRTTTSRLDDTSFAEWNEMLQGYAEKYEHYLDSVFTGLEGRMFVM
jgi:hypothetical protein